MSNSIQAMPFHTPIEAARKSHSGSPTAPTLRGGIKAGTFEQFLTHAEKEFLSTQLQQMKWSK